MIVVGGEMLVDLVPLPGTGPADPVRRKGGASDTDVADASAASAAPAGPDLRPHLGGGPFNVAIAAGLQGAEVAFLTRLSTDAYGRAGLERLVATGIDVALVQLGEEPTTLAITQLDADGSATYDFHWAGSADRFVADPGALDADVVCLGTCSLVVEPGATVYETVLVRESERGRVVMVDPNIRPAIIADAGLYRDRFRSWLPHVTVLKLSDADLRWLLDDPDADVHAACRAIAAGTWTGGEPGPTVVLTEGARGATAFTTVGAVTAEAPLVDVVDTIGAGDTIMGTIAVEIDRRLRAGTGGDFGSAVTVRSWGPDEWAPILQRAAAAAAVTVSRPGANPPTAAELD
ncbi:PfkB family carbohydrate kinase [uncultured Corynebacterium sp.]|uniref:PfkB family carbohydrate kinase n=1 Tax=uncultured Corynebacterium sp. TaxID=159447 RepID=UPI0025E00915|nr:PfkB family carbohydrate kinase [uncultured Corynebacterium sp.]